MRRIEPRDLHPSPQLCQVAYAPGVATLSPEGRGDDGAGIELVLPLLAPHERVDWAHSGKCLPPHDGLDDGGLQRFA